MSEVTRRDFVGMTALAGGLAAVAPILAEARPRMGADFTVDGIPLTPAEYVDNETLRGASVEALAGAFHAALG